MSWAQNKFEVETVKDKKGLNKVYIPVTGSKVMQFTLSARLTH